MWELAAHRGSAGASACAPRGARSASAAVHTVAVVWAADDQVWRGGGARPPPFRRGRAAAALEVVADEWDRDAGLVRGVRVGDGVAPKGGAATGNNVAHRKAEKVEPGGALLDRNGGAGHRSAHVQALIDVADAVARQHDDLRGRGRSRRELALAGAPVRFDPDKLVTLQKYASWINIC